MGATVIYTDTTVSRNRTYYYQVFANDLIGDATVYAAPAIGYPTLSLDSAPSNMVEVITSGPAGAVFIFADSLNTLAAWSGVFGNVQVITQAAMGGVPGTGMAAVILPLAPLGVNAAAVPQPAYVVDNSPDRETSYNASFYFDPNDFISGSEPVEIFAGLDQDGQLTFGVQIKNHAAPSDDYDIRAWVMQNGERAYTDWVVISDARQLIEVDWQSGSAGGLGLLVDDVKVASLIGNTSAYQVDGVLLGPSTGVNASTAGTLYFDEFASNRIQSGPYAVYMPMVIH